MPKSIRPFLVCSLVFLLTGCAAYQPEKGYTALPMDGKVVVNGYFADPENDYVYKANISVYGNELTGILIAKKINEEAHRVVFTTEFGNKLIDFEVSPNDFRINSIVEELDRKILVRTLERDFRLLLNSHWTVTQAFEKDGNTIYKIPQGKRSNFIFIDAGGKLPQLVQASKTKQKIKISFTPENDNFARHIVIEHYDIRLRIELNHFKEN